MPTVYLTDSLVDRDRIEAEAVEIRGSLVTVDPIDGQRVLVPMDRVAGIEGGEIDRHVDRIPTQGGQYTELVTSVEN